MVCIYNKKMRVFVISLILVIGMQSVSAGDLSDSVVEYYDGSWENMGLWKITQILKMK